MKNTILLIISINSILTQVLGTPIEKFLFDSTQYQGELNWDKEAFGDSSELPGWKEQSFSQKSGDVWRVHFVCDISSSNPNNWLRLPFIDRDEANRLVIKLEYTIRECKKYPGEIRSCKETFQLLYIDSDGDQAPSSFSESNYKYLKTIAPNSELNSKSSSTVQTSLAASASTPNIFRTEVDLPLRSSKKGVYLVFRDQGACVSLLSIKISYTLCSSQLYNLALYPRTPTGSNLTDLVQKNGKCIQNAESKSTPYAYCQTNGNWFFINNNMNINQDQEQLVNQDEDSNVVNSNSCQCKAGYFYSALLEQCLACPQGKYKADLSNHAECTPCPDYSYSRSVASKHCTCIDGYYRMNANDLNTACLPYPPEPKNLTVYYIDQASIKLRWNSIDNYDKNLVQYKLECFKCLELNRLEQNIDLNLNTNFKLNLNSKRQNSFNCQQKVLCENFIEINPKKEQIFDNKVSLTQMDSNQLYQIELYAQHLNGLFKTKTVDILVKTSEALDDLQVKNLTAYQFVDMNQILVLWKPDLDAVDSGSSTSTQSSSVLSNSLKTNFNFNSNKHLSYEIRYWPKDQFDKANIINIKAPAHNFTFKNSNPSIINSNLYVFQIRAKTSLGWSPYSDSVESIRISTISYYSNFNKSTASPSSSQTFDQLKLVVTNAQSLNKTESFTIYIIIAILSSLCFVVLVLTLLVMLSRSGRVKFLSNYLTKQGQSSAPGSDCDSIDFAKRNAQLAYNQFSGAGTTSSSGGSSPLWPKTYIDPHTYEDPTKVVSLFARELSHSNIIIESVIGGGEFGDVCKGCLKLTPWSDQVVAIKTLKGAATEQNRCDFLTEASIMAQFNDPNVIRLEGVVTQLHPLMIVTEYMENGSLDTFLRLNESKLKVSQMIKILKDVASGMKYLSEMNYIHRDLAARNILVNKDLICKVADFGLSREIDIDSYEYTTKGGKIPIRWTAPEACNFRKYTCASDVWSFGVLAWEVFSLGERPYWSWENKEVVRAIQELYRLPPPQNCPDCVYKLMLRCWQEDRNLRPKFAEICLILDEMLTYTDELKQPAKIRELLPINARAPTKIQMTRTKLFLSRLNLEHYTEIFERVGLGNLSNLFQLEAKDLALSLSVQNQFDQKRILEELKRISDGFNQNILSNQQNQNSYTLFNSNSNNFNNNANINLNANSMIEQFNMNLAQQHQIQQRQQQQQSIFNLIRNQPQNPNHTQNDLLSFSALPSNLSNVAQSNGFLV